MSSITLTLTPEQRDLLQLGLLLLSSAVDRDELGRLAERWPRTRAGRYPSRPSRMAQIEAVEQLLRHPEPVTLVVHANGHPVPPMTGSTDIDVITVREAPRPPNATRQVRPSLTATRARLRPDKRAVARVRRCLDHD
jgi:hypothetical protein